MLLEYILYSISLTSLLIKFDNIVLFFNTTKLTLKPREESLFASQTDCISAPPIFNDEQIM